MTDLVMPLMDGIETLEHIMAFDPTIDVILMTAYYSTESAVEAIRKGATDYLDKPISIDTLRDRVGKLARLHRARIHALDPDHFASNSNYFEGMVGNSPEMWQLYSKIQRVAPHFRTLLLRGATGTGKELVAQALHHLSGTKQEFVPLNCSAVVETLFESELFGHVKGAFTGATDNKIGLFEHAHNGTLFLDEVGDMPITTQAKLLRALQNQEVQQLGSLRARKVNVRVIAATHRDLRAMIQQGRFREDLFYRLSMVELEVPSLVDRQGDIELLARSFLAKWAKQYDRKVSDFTQRALMILKRHHWPGNVRELENAIGHAAMMSAGPVIDASDLPQYLLQPAAGTEAETLSSPATIPSLADREKELVIEALKKSRANQSEAARILEISRDKLRYKMKKYGLV
jgi:DNA-binding NtrC family response regulator